MTAWLAQATGDAVVPVDPAWLNPAAAADKAASEVVPMPAKGRERRKGKKTSETALAVVPQQEKKSKNARKAEGRQRGWTGRLEEAEQMEDDDLDELRNLFS